MGFSRDTFYRYQSAMAAGGIDVLIDANRKKPNLRNRVEEATEVAVAAFALEQPAFGQVRVSNELRKPGIFISRLDRRHFSAHCYPECRTVAGAGDRAAMEHRGAWP
jgi:hypothetical protein